MDVLSPSQAGSSVVGSPTLASAGPEVASSDNAAGSKDLDAAGDFRSTGFSAPQTVPVHANFENVGQVVLRVTADRASIVLVELADSVERRRAWLAPASLSV